MKRKLSLLCAMLLLLTILTGCNASEIVEDGDYEYGKTDFPKGYFIVSYLWDGDSQNVDIYIPETYDGRSISEVGGYLGRGLPCPFSVVMPDEFEIPNEDDKAFCTDDAVLVTDTDFDIYRFTIHIGKNIKKFYGESNSYYGRDEESGQDIWYEIEYDYLVDEDNPYLELVDGVVCEKN